MIALMVLAFVAFVVAIELVAAVLPLVVVLIWVPPQERAGLAAVLAAASGSRRHSVWSALRLIAAKRGRLEG